ncbi:RNA polymerase sigma factor RpoE [Succinivibrio dextrinosolvens]|jgi:RNA polymerase sigma-70 factor (ECF subfamily)|uniref:RNA polymerase, sigma-24 subunit, RpoE n=1 Tax=Succinivibrio dextrinosolvens DSM 3072 TaxID=1123324 RepID=A0A1T4VFP5_9GAMM|nr:RNA polymerase sigma factor RpoE [Succinivibrio dextrinosolvens]MBE6423978.1 RNA polymerase sigma factor RpoE [Succinivibrio dextrinosolvens]MBQ3679376.1 RNA polymerase sigma factor RpoE [Succinivibrio sp.]SKA63784.1 RNA polymerase, sigma-24 subunit, RpoE [Succinivibrio dextrinosolvens DSM 3072]
MASDENLQKASSDEALVKRVQQGDVNAYNILVIKYQHKVAQIISKFVGNSADVNDVAQEAFIKAYKAINNFRGESSFYTWLYRIVVNSAKTYLESNSKRKNHIDVDSEEFQSIDAQGVLTSKESPDKIIESQELQQVILSAMKELPEELRQAIMLREVEGMSYEDMADLLQIPIGTVRSRIFRARQFIEERMSRFAGK